MYSLLQANRIVLLTLLFAFLATAIARGQITLSTDLLDFGTCTGDTIVRVFIVTNVGGAGVDVELSDPDEPFIILENKVILSLGVLETRSVTVGYVGRAGANSSPNDESEIEISFRTKDSEPISGSLTVRLRASCPDGGTTNGNDSIYFSLRILDLGNVIVGSPSVGTISIDNGSSADATVSVGTLSSPYSIGSGGGTVTVGAGASHDVVVIINPTTTGTFNTWLPIVYRSGSNEPDTILIVIRATATNGGGDVLMTNRTEVDFGSTPFNTAVDQSITLRNADMSNTITVRGNVAGAIGGPFAILSGGGFFELAPGETHTVVIRFLPTVQGNFSDSVIVSFETVVNGTPTGNGRAVIQLHGQGRTGSEGGAVLIFSDTEVLFNNGNPVHVGTTVEETIAMSNPGASPVEIRFIGPNLPFANGSATDTMTIAPGSTRTVVVRFSPTVAGTFVGTLQVIYGPSGNQNLQNIILLGVATDATTGVASSEIPRSVMLEPFVPNPTGGRARLAFTTDRSVDVTIALHNALGERVATIFEEHVAQGTHTVEFDAARLESGVYFCRMTAGEETQTRSLTVVR